MTELSKDVITFISATGGIIGVVYATTQYVKSRAMYIKKDECEKQNSRVKLAIEKESTKRETEVANIQNKITLLSDRVSTIEGRLQNEKGHK